MWDAFVAFAGCHLMGEELAVDRLAGDGEPLFPLLWGLRLVIGVEQEIPASRASAVLRLQKPQTAFVQRWWGFLAPPADPILGQRRIVSSRRIFLMRPRMR